MIKNHTQITFFLAVLRNRRFLTFFSGGVTIYKQQLIIFRFFADVYKHRPITPELREADYKVIPKVL